MWAVNELKKRVDAKAFISKKEFVKANAVMKAYYMLDRWPLYKFTKKNDTNLDVAVIGRHAMREEFVKAVYSCTHMLGRTTRIRIYASDAKVFWEELEKKNPLLGRTIRLFINGKCMRSEADVQICSKPIAEIYLYDDGEARLKSNYILLLEESGEYQKSAKWICQQIGREEQKLVAYLDYGCSCLSQKKFPEHTFVPIPLLNKCSYYDEKLLETELLQYALNVHALYYRNNHRRATWEELKGDFESSIYNIESSMRSALTVKYKLYSIGLEVGSDVAGKNIAEKFHEKVLSEEAAAKKLFSELSALEHLSWSSYLIMNGWNVPTREQIEEYAFVGKNDFKEKERLLHPCLVECKPGRGLENWTQEEWEIPLDSNERAKRLDALDRMSVMLHQIAREKSKKAMKKINAQMENLGELVQQYHLTELQNGFQWMNQVKNKIFVGEANADTLWRQAENNFMEILQKYEFTNPQFYEFVERIRQELRVINEFYAYHEYKTSDDAIITGIPYILTGDKVKRIVKPYIAGKKAGWKNILTSLCLEPEELVFLDDFAGRGLEEKDYQNIDNYRKMFEKRGIQTKISVKSVEKIDRDIYNTVWDATGLSRMLVKRLQDIQKKLDMTQEAIIVLQDEEVIGLEKFGSNQFSRNTHLHVEEIFELFGENIELTNREEIALSLAECYKNIWNARIQIANDVWEKVSETLLQAEKKNCFEFSYRKGREKRYQTEPVNGKALQLAKIHKLLRRCKEEGLVTDYFCPGEEDELSVVIHTEARAVFEALQKIIRTASEEPLQHKYQIEKVKDGRYRIRDGSLHVKLENVSEEEKRALRILEGCGKDAYRQQVILQNLKIEENSVSFKYASEPVKQCLQAAESILDIMIYHECRLRGDYDDIKIGKYNRIWCSKNAKMNCIEAALHEVGKQKRLQTAYEKDCFRLSGEAERTLVVYPIQRPK